MKEEQAVLEFLLKCCKQVCAFQKFFVPLRLQCSLTTQQLDIYGTSEQYQGPVCIIHGTKDGIVPLWCSERYDSIYNHSVLHLIEGENHLMIKHLNRTKAIISDFLRDKN